MSQDMRRTVLEPELPIEARKHGCHEQDEGQGSEQEVPPQIVDKKFGADDCGGKPEPPVDEGPERGLIAEVGRLESVGRPILYGVTEMFMQHFGLSDLKDLPPLEENEADRLWAASLLADPGAESTPEADTEPDADSPADS